MRTLSLLLLCSAVAASAAVSARNEHLQFDLDTTDMSFQIQRAGRQGPLIRGGKLSRPGGTARAVDIADRIFGQGKAVEVAYADGGRDTVALFPGLPFVLFRSTLRNGSAALSVTNKFRSVEFTVDGAGMSVLGTGGLRPAAKAPGSYMWLAAADPATRRGMVAGWITSDRGSGVLLPRTDGARLTIAAQIDYGKLRIPAGASETLETLAIGWFDDARLGLEAWADAIARVYSIKLPPQPDGYCTWYHARASDETKLASQTAFAARQLKPYGLSFIQIDDGWQDGEKKNGPKKNFTRVDPKGPYPSGMKKTADMIKASGLVPGIWFMPFAGTFDDPWFKDRQDWFVKRENGQPYDVRWGGTSLDMTNPAAREYVSGIVRAMAKDWGFEYFKMDGLWTGSATEMEYVNDAYKDDQIGNAVFHDPSRTNIEAFRGGLRLVRDAAGPKVFLLGCNSQQNMRSYGGAFGLLDAMRIGPDNGPKWPGILRGPIYGSRNYHLHGRVWWNDPDPLYVRVGLPIEQARLISSWVTVSGQLSVSSDAYAELPPERLDILRRTLPSHGFPARPVDLFERDIPRIWFVRGNSRDVIGLFNWDTAEAEIEYPLDRIGLEKGVDYEAFEFWTNRTAGPFRDTLRMRLPPQSAAVLAVRPASAHPQLMSTSRHIMQGMTDVSGEAWNGRELSATSRLVAGDPYEMRIATHGWKLAGVDAPRAVKSSFREDGRLARVTLETPAGGDVRWRLRFTR